MKLDVLLSALKEGYEGEYKNKDIVSVVCDSRQVKEGSLFVAIKGDKADGINFIDDAIGRGASVIVTDTDVIQRKKEVCYIKVPDARQALGNLSCAFYGYPSNAMRVFGITGTNGKTTTAYLTRHIFSRHGEPTGTITTIEYGIKDRTIPASRTTPEAPVLQFLLSQMRTAGCINAVMEVSSHALVQKRVAGIEFDCAIFTNLTRDHLDYHKSRENYIAAKELLFLELGKGKKKAVAIINADDPCAERMIKAVNGRGQIITYGINNKCDVNALDIRFLPEGLSFRVKSPWGEVKITSNLMGRFNVYNILAALSACSAFNVRLEEIADSILTMQQVPGRLEEVKNDKGFKIFVDYAHTDDALENVLRTLREVTKKRLIVVFGCGGNRDVTKRPAMGRVAGQLADFTIVTSDNPRKEDPLKIIEEIKAGIPPSALFEIESDRKEAIKKAINYANTGDIILIAGKGHEKFQEFANITVLFDDRLVAAELLKTK